MTVHCTDLRCERLVDPIGLDATQPRLTWRLHVDAGQNDVVQEAHEVEVEGVWSSGRIEGWRQQVAYAGPALASRRVYRWRVQAWTNAGPTGWSAWATFEPGLLQADEWVARMIAADGARVVRFATTVDVPAETTRARLRLTAHGIVEARIDGVVVGDEVLAPGWTSYGHRLVVRTHDVTGLVSESTEIALTVAPGWFSGRIGWEEKVGLYGQHRGVLAQLEFEQPDGGWVVHGTDDAWTATTTRISDAEIYDGETCDARQPVVGDPLPLRVVEVDPTTLIAPPVPPVRRTQVLHPVSRHESVLDFGQNLVGWLRLRLREPVPAGTTITLRHAELLAPDGSLHTAPLRTAKATDTYRCAGVEGERYEPTFTFHGFRYAEIAGVDPSLVEVEAVVVHTDVERTGTFTCSDPLLERLHANVDWGWRGNAVSVPTDCPQRDERLGWTGDAQVFAPTASFLYDCQTFWEHWLGDVAADQTEQGSVPHVIPAIALSFDTGAAGWGDAAVTIPWSTYLAYGDPHVLVQAMPSMLAWVEYVWGRLDDLHRWTQDFQFGDWLDPDAPIDKPWEAKARFDLVATAYAAHTNALVSKAAAVVGNDEASATYRSRAALLREAWWDHYGASCLDSQTGAALALAFDLAPADARQSVGDALARRVADAGDHLATGFLGTPVLLPSLTATGHLDAAYRVLVQRSCPSWLYQVIAGATTIWERWDALRPDGSVPLDSLGGGGTSMVSFNHYAYGAVADWLHSTVAGLRPDADDPGYHHLLVEPRPGGGLTSASAALETRYGVASVAWQIEGGRLAVRVEVPPNTSATVTLPGAPPVTVGSGTHGFSS